MYNILDIETVPLPLAEIQEFMPEHIRNPVMPGELQNPVMHELKVPLYGGDKEKQSAYIEAQTAKWKAKCEQECSAWNINTQKKREQFFADAALDPKLSTVKMVGIKTSDKEFSKSQEKIYLCEPEKELGAAIARRKKGITLFLYEKESDLLVNVFADIREILSVEDEKIVTFYGNQFDFPFLFRRAWILGIVPPLGRLRKGRYWREELVDLYEVFTLGDRQYKMGGLDGLCKILGLTDTKDGDGAGFSELYDNDPVDAINYCLKDLNITAQCAKKLLG